MIAIDTNIIVRLLTEDDEAQARRAHALLASQRVQVETSVILETAWVLEASYDYSRTELVRALAAFIALPQVELSEPARVTAALGWAAGGMDLADALHLANSRGCSAFYSFDRNLAKVAEKLNALPVRQP